MTNMVMKYLDKTIEYGLYLLAFTLPLGTRWIIKAGETEYLTYSLYGTDILLVLLLALFLFYKSQIPNPNNQTNPKSQITNILIAGLMVVSFASIFFAIDKPLAVFKFGWLILGAGLFWLVSRAAYERAKLIWSLLAGLALQSLLALWQFLTQSAFSNKWLGLASHRAADLGASVVETIGADGVGERWLRAYGGFDHPNILGGVMAVGVLLLVGQYLKFPIINYKFQNIFKIISWIFLPLFSAALFFSFSRAGWLALAAGLAVMLVGAVIKKNFQAQKNILQAIFISGVIFLILFSQLPNLVMTRLYGGGRLEVKSKNERLESIKYSLPIIKKKWASGAGLGNYVLALKRELPGQASYFYQPVHNAYLLVLSEIGIVGFIIFICLLIFVLVRLLRRPADAGLLAMTTALIVLLSFDHWLWSLHFGVLFFFLTIGLVSRTSVDK